MGAAWLPSTFYKGYKVYSFIFPQEFDLILKNSTNFIVPNFKF